MSFRRTKTGVSLATIRKTASGRPRCRQCGREVPKGRRTFCGSDCIHAWKLVRDPSYVRQCVLERDNGICADCGMDTIAEWLRLRLLARTDPGAYEQECAERKIPQNRGSVWDADHIHEVADGGGETGLENYATRCLWCHRKKSGENHSARSKRRKQAS